MSLKNDAIGKIEMWTIGYFILSFKEKAQVTTMQEEFQPQKNEQFSVSKGQSKMKVLMLRQERFNWI